MKILQITDVRVILIKGKNRLKGICSVMIDNCFLIHDIGIIEREQGVFISMPSKKTIKGVFKDIAHPTNSETRQMMETEIVKVYHKMLEKEK